MSEPIVNIHLIYAAVAEAVLNKCAVATTHVPAHGDQDYSVVYNYEFLEDFRHGTEEG